jgi:DNA modification methylase
MIKQVLQAALAKRAQVADGTPEAADIDRDIAALRAMLPVTPGECRLIQGDALGVLRTLPPASVQCCITSPPYYGLRDYGVKGQIGAEETPRAYVAGLVNVFGHVWRVLKDDGVLWLNLGDSYARQGGAKSEASYTSSGTGNNSNRKLHRGAEVPPDGVKAKDLLGIPWRVAFALQKAGWYLRSAAPWVKRNAMPDSVKDRPVTAVEYWFMFTKAARYYYDADAVKKLYSAKTVWTYSQPDKAARAGQQRNGTDNSGLREKPDGDGRSRRNSDWWFESVGMLLNESDDLLGFDVPTAPYRGAHFATFPPKLVEPQILSCSRPGDTVLDPFNGAGTTGLVALRHGRSYVGIDLNPEYLAMTRQRIAAERG